MPSIDQIVGQIRTAIYGKDVRENIALGIEECYADRELDRGNTSSAMTAADISMLLNSTGEYTIRKDDLEQGGYREPSPHDKYNADNRIRVGAPIAVAPGTSISVRYSNLDYLLMSDPPDLNGWHNAGTTYSITCNKYMYIRFIFRKHDNTDLIPNDYNCTINLKTSLMNDVINDLINEKDYNERYPIGQLTFRYGGFNVDSQEFVKNKIRFISDLHHFGDKIISVYSGSSSYDFVMYKYENGVYSVIRGWTSSTYYVHTNDNADYMFMFRKSDDSQLTPDDLLRIRIHEVENNDNVLGHGLIKHEPEWAENTYFTYYEAGGRLLYAALDGRFVCTPIKIPKSGLRITYNPKYSDQNKTAPFFRVVVVNLVDNGYDGFEYSTDNEVLNVASHDTMHRRYSVYIPYVENAYVIINGMSNDTVDDISDAIYVYSGDITDTGGRLPGLHPVKILGTTSNTYKPPEISFGTTASIVNTSRHYGGAVNLAHIKKMYCGPKYSLIANVYKENADGTYTCIDYIWGSNTSTDNLVNGVQYIDFEKYGQIDGIVLYAIQCTSRYYKTDSTHVSVEYTGMGVMNGYDYVYANTFVEYKNGFELSFMDGLDSRIADNVYYYSHFTVPKRFPVSYVNYHEYDAGDITPRQTITEYDCSPTFYAGSYETQTPFLAVTPKSYYTAMQNPNSRCYTFGEDGRLGYGLSCTDFCSVMTGLLENYPVSSAVFNDVDTFERISDNWDYRTQMDLLKPGDWLGRQQPYSGGSPTSGSSANEIRGHLMMVYEIMRVKGAIQYINLMEAGYPYTRFTALVSDKYESVLGHNSMESVNTTFSRLGQYVHLRRPKPEYIRSIKDNWDMNRYTNGTLMCDRGKDSVYCLLKDGTMGNLYISCSDNNASKIYIYRRALDNSGSDVYVGAVSISSQRNNDLRVTNIKSHITQPGYYKLKTSTTGDVQESFYVPNQLYYLPDDPDYNPNDSSTINKERDLYNTYPSDSIITTHVPNYNDLLYCTVAYRIDLSNGSRTYIYKNFLKRDIVRDGNLNAGIFSFPRTYGNTGVLLFNDAPYSFVTANYRDQRYGCYKLNNFSSGAMTSEFDYNRNA